MKNVSYGLIVCFLLSISGFLPAQTAAEIEEMLKSEALSYEEVARFVLKAADVPGGQLNLNDSAGAFRFAAEQKWLPRKAAAADKASLKGVSLLLMRSFDIKGGLFFTVFKNPHYAYREMVYQDIIQGRADPAMAVSGDQLLFLVGSILSRQEEEAELTFPGKAQERPAVAGEAQEGPAAVEEQQKQPPQVVEVREERQRIIIEAHRYAERLAMVEEINARLSARAVSDTSARISDQGVTINLSKIEFLANPAELPESEKRKLQEIGQILQTISHRKILITGHTALMGSAEDRLKTSQDRAAAVAAFLVSMGTRRANEIFVQGLGAEQPIADNSSPQGMSLNRRVEIIILEDL